MRRKLALQGFHLHFIIMIGLLWDPVCWLRRLCRRNQQTHQTKKSKKTSLLHTKNNKIIKNNSSLYYLLLNYLLCGVLLKHLHILYFKNINERQLHFSGNIAVIAGNNGIGKTNLLDAIYYLAMTKSYFASSDIQNIQFNHDFFMIQGKFENDEQKYEINCSVKKSEGKKINFNQKTYQKISEHIGKIPLVFIAPQDLSLITEYADTRRKFIDALISKFDKEYLNALIQYHHYLQNRNKIIKQGEAAYQQQDLIEIYNIQMAQYGEIILNKRKYFFDEITLRLNEIYHQLQESNECLSLRYLPSVQNNFLKELQHALPKDIRLGYSTIGIHRDDFEILLNNYPAKNFASQGQQKTIVFALKWIELVYLYQKTKIHPLLLIDDIYDHLDKLRLNKIKILLKTAIPQQIFITDSNKNRIQQLFYDQDIEIVELEQKTYKNI